MDTTLVLKFINEAFKQSPQNSDGGYQFAMGTVASLCVVLLGVVWFLYRDQKRERRSLDAERKQARKDAAIQIDGQFSAVRSDLSIGLDDMQKQINTHFGNTQGQYAATREELTRLKTIIEIMQKGLK